MNDSVYVKFPILAQLSRKKVNQWLPGRAERMEWGVSANEYGVSFWND